jgi:hypothetical protein
MDPDLRNFADDIQFRTCLVDRIRAVDCHLVEDRLLSLYYIILLGKDVSEEENNNGQAS